MKHLFKKKLFSIPNLMGYFRPVIIPVSVRLYLHVVMDIDYYRVALVMGISSITDMFDGTVVRKFNMITEFGKFLGPPAGKLTHGVILLCLLNHCPLIFLLVVPSAVEEGFTFVMGAIKLRQGKKLDGAMWFGKCCTALFFAVLFLSSLFPHMPVPLVNGLILLCGIMIAAIPMMYVRVFRRMQGRF